MSSTSRAGPRPSSPLAAFVRKELHHILRDRQTLAILLLMPLVQVLLFGYALRTDIRDLRVAIVDPTPDAVTLRLRSRLAATTRFRLVNVSPSSKGLEELFERRSADVAIVIPASFAETVARGDSAQLLLITDASDPNSGTTMQAYTRSVLADFESELAG